jgi:hypothetical protein
MEVIGRAVGIGGLQLLRWRFEAVSIPHFDVERILCEDGAAVANSGRGGIAEVSSWWGGSTLVETACFVAEWVRGEGGGWGRSVMDMVVCAKIKKC